MQKDSMPTPPLATGRWPGKGLLRGMAPAPPRAGETSLHGTAWHCSQPRAARPSRLCKVVSLQLPHSSHAVNLGSCRAARPRHWLASEAKAHNPSEHEPRVRSTCQTGGKHCIRACKRTALSFIDFIVAGPAIALGTLGCRCGQVQLPRLLDCFPSHIESAIVPKHCFPPQRGGLKYLAFVGGRERELRGISYYSLWPLRPLARAETGDAIVLPLPPFAPPAKHGLCSPNSETVSQPSPKLAVDRHAIELALLRAWGPYVDTAIQPRCVASLG